MNRSGLILGIVLCVVFVFATASPAMADRTHRVRSGQTLSHIARRYHVTISSLAGANSMDTDGTLRSGQVLRVPEIGEAFVAPGQTLSHVARAHDIGIAALARANSIRPNARLRIGQRLVLPGFTANEAAARRRSGSPEDTTDYGRPDRPGRVTLLRAGQGRVQITLLDRRGRPRNAAINQLSRFMRFRTTTRSPPPPRRLVQLLARVSDHFGGRPISVISGYRPAGGYTRASSRHTQGHALDIRIQGIPNTVLRDYCRSFENVGVGYYPNSSFVHFDVRDQSTYWVDYSGPGDRPDYRSPSPESDSAESPEAPAADVTPEAPAAPEVPAVVEPSETAPVSDSTD